MNLPATGPAAAPPLSRYQERIIEFVRSGEGHGVVKATAGAGKTSTLLAVAAQLDPATKACFLAFGRDAAAELARKLPDRVAAMTVHSLGRSTLARALGTRRKRLGAVDRWKYRRLLRAAFEELPAGSRPGPAGLAECEEYLTGLLGLARLHLVAAGDDDALGELALRHAIVPPEPELLPLAHRLFWRVLERGVAQALDQGICDFTDMLYLPVTQGMQPVRFDFVCVDEAQDYSAAALAFTRQLVDTAADGRLLFVGDPRQSIYGFAGADALAMERIVTETNATVLPLSITYRCPRSHVELARLLAPEIEAGPTAGEGRVFWIHDRVLERWAREGDMIICRANAPLVKTCLLLARAGLRAHVRGRDLERQLLDLCSRALEGGSSDLIARLDAYEARERARAQRSAGSAALPVIEARRDLYDCLRHLLLRPGAGVTSSPAGLRELIATTFAQQERSVVLSTIHRAKGLEADRIILLYPELMPAPYARTSHSLLGEAAVQFVALTRARCDLVFVSESPPRSPGSDTRPAPDNGTDGLSPDDRVGQGPGVWREVMELARVLARNRG